MADVEVMKPPHCRDDLGNDGFHRSFTSCASLWWALAPREEIALCCKLSDDIGVEVVLKNTERLAHIREILLMEETDETCVYLELSHQLLTKEASRSVQPAMCFLDGNHAASVKMFHDLYAAPVVTTSLQLLHKLEVALAPLQGLVAEILDAILHLDSQGLHVMSESPSAQVDASDMLTFIGFVSDERSPSALPTRKSARMKDQHTIASHGSADGRG
eukprot:CAMPEP_0170579372 /NCGR_PEP_ID=MMETSP0224-20130122/5950_1 /TAXON_ID=285029 /ORGANISM="Togula jolla, Strain CCCM 725" /LENGTH=216 /DNA_ID=CAMNT_0010902395 /DNA_START=588 /DNA_END=1239 /DNA_ORIENTATION=-